MTRLKKPSFKGVKLEKLGQFYNITEASGKRVTPGELKQGRSYLYHHLYKYRTIVGLTAKNVVYKDDVGYYGECSRVHLCRMCPTECTRGEKAFIDWEVKNITKNK